MDTVEVKAFNSELSGLYENKPPISKAKMSAITKGAIKAIKFYKHVVHSVEKFIQKCKPEYKVPGLYVIDSIVRQSRHQFGQEKDVFAPRFAKNMQQTFANLFRCPPEDKRNIIRVLNLWQKNHVFSSEVIQPLLDMADPNHPLHQEIQQQNNTANGSSLNISHDSKMSPQRQDSPHAASPMGDQFQDEPSGIPVAKFNRKLLNDFEYDSEDEPTSDPPLPQHAQHTQHMHTQHSQHSNQHTHQQHNQHTHQQHNMQTTNMSHNPADALGSILTNPEIMRQLQSLQAQMQMMTGVPIPNLMPMMPDMSQQNQNQNLPFLNVQNTTKEPQKSAEPKDDMANESDIEFVETGPQVIEIPDANDSRSPSPVSRRHRSRSRSPRRRRRSRSRSPRRRHARDRDRDRDREKTYKEREAEKEKQREREKKGLPPIKKENLSVCSTTLWVGHLSKLATPEELSDLFGAFGGVAAIDVVAPRGCAFVVMERRRDAARAKAKLDKHKLHSKEITVAWAAGKGVKGREWKDYWEAELGVAYLPWAALHARWLLGALSLDALEEGGAVDEETLPPWLPPRIIPKATDGMNMMGSMLPPASLPLPTSLPALSTPLAPPPAAPLRMPPPGMTPGIPPGMAPGIPAGMRPPSIPTGVPGLQRDASLPPPGPLLGFPPGMPQPGMVGGFLGGLMGMGMGVGGLMPLPLAHPHAPALAPPPAQQAPAAQQEPADDAMELDTDEGDRSEPPPLSLDQIQALLSKPPPAFNSSEPPPGFTEPDTSQPPPDSDRREDERRDRDKERRERRDRDRDGRDTRDGRDRRDTRDGRDRRDTRERDRPRDRERERDERRDRDRDRDRGRDRRERGERDRDRDRERDRFNNRDNNNTNRERSREKSPRGEKSLQERLWEMANGAGEPPPAPAQGPAQPNPPPLQPQPNQSAPADNAPDRDEGSSAAGEGGPSGGAPASGNSDGGWSQLPPPRQMPPMFRAGPWMDLQGPPGPFGPRFNGMGPPFPRPPFDRPPFDGAMFERPPFNRMPFDVNRPPFDGPRPPFDGMRPPFDGSRPPFDGPRPSFDGLRPPFDGPQRPPFDGPRPPFDGSRLPFDGPRPPFDGPRPPFDGPRLPFDGPRPPFDGPRPRFDGPRPTFDGSRPPFDGNRPPFDGSRPPFDGPRPPFDSNRKFDGFEAERPFDGPPENFDRENRRFEDREQFNDRGWNGDRERDWDRRGEWDDRRRDRRREHEDRYRDNRGGRQTEDRRRNYDRPEDRTRQPREEKREEKREERRRDKDRKSRWGAAEETGAEETGQPSDPSEQADALARTVEELTQERQDSESRIDGADANTNETDEPASRAPDTEQRDHSVQDGATGQDKYDTGEPPPQWCSEGRNTDRQDKDEDSSMNEKQNKSEENKPVEANLTLDLYDANEEVERSFTQATPASETESGARETERDVASAASEIERDDTSDARDIEVGVANAASETERDGASAAKETEDSDVFSVPVGASVRTDSGAA